MTFPHDGFEFVRVASKFRLFDEDSYQHKYTRANGVSLEPGVYIVHWPADITNRRYDERACFDGPFKNLDNAGASIREMQTAEGGSRGDHAEQPSHRFVVDWVLYT